MRSRCDDEFGQAWDNDRVIAKNLGDGPKLIITNSTHALKRVWIEPLCVDVCVLEPEDFVEIEFVNGRSTVSEVNFDDEVITIWDADIVETRDYAWRLIKRPDRRTEKGGGT